jgi:ABC-type transport system involved in cytochrome bd biosynthesis fused ATPase/permease subunit
MLALVYYLFFSVNTLTFALLSTMQTFLAIIDRLGNVLEMDEYKPSRTEDGIAANTKIVMENASFSWGFRAKTLTDEEKKARAKQRSYRVELDEVEDNVVSDLNLKMKQGDMLMVVGQVGCGKSSFLHAVMGELKKTSGSTDINGKIAYVEQEPFIYSASVIDNIIFGNTYDSDKF